MILASSWEYEKLHNAEIIERPSDNEELPAVRIYIYMLLKFSCMYE